MDDILYSEEEITEEIYSLIIGKSDKFRVLGTGYDFIYIGHGKDRWRIEVIPYPE